MPVSRIDPMHDCVFPKDNMTKDETHAAWFTAVRGGHADDLQALAARGCNPFILCGQQTARTMVKNWSTRLGRLESDESDRQRLFQNLHGVLYQAEMNWLIHKKLKRAFSKWHNE